MSDAPPVWDADDPVASWAAWAGWLTAGEAEVPLDRAARLIDGLAALPDHAAGVAAWRRRLAQRHQMVMPRIVLTGDPKAGRSTLLNGLMGRPLLRTAVRACTPAPVTVFALGVRFTEVPPGQRPPPADGHLLVVDVRQPLPRTLRVAPRGDGPTVLVLTKLDRARSDAVLSPDPEAEVVQAIDVARRRARARTAGKLAETVVCDPRDADAVRRTTWPALRVALAAAWSRAATRRDVEDARFVDALSSSLVPPPPLAWPPQISTVAPARAVLQAGVSLAMASVASDAAAWRARVRRVDDHAELDGLVERVPEALDDIGRRAVDRATQGCQDALASWVMALADTLSATTPWAAPPRSLRPQVLALGVDGGVLARSTASRVQAAAPPAFLGMVRLRRVEARRAELEATWSEALAELQLDLGGALRDAIEAVESALRETVQAWTAHVETVEHAALVAESRRRTAERFAILAARDWLTGERERPSSETPARTL